MLRDASKGREGASHLTDVKPVVVVGSKVGSGAYVNEESRVLYVESI